MKNLIILIFVFVTSNTIVLPQEKITLGIRDEIGITNIKIGDDFTKTNFFVIPIQNLYLTINFIINEKHSLQLRPGYIMTKNDFEGWEVGGYWIYIFPNHNFYSSIGVNLHFNGDNTGGNSGGTGNTISLLGFGIGYEISRIISFEASYHHPLKKNYGLFFYETSHYDHLITNIIKLGISIRIFNY